MAREIPESITSNPIHIVEGSFAFFRDVLAAFDWLVAHGKNKSPEFAPIHELLGKIVEAEARASIDKASLTLSASEAATLYCAIEDFNDAVTAGLVLAKPADALAKPDEIQESPPMAADTLNGASE